jgi:uncharacterized protein YggE
MPTDWAILLAKRASGELRLFKEYVVKALPVLLVAVLVAPVASAQTPAPADTSVVTAIGEGTVKRAPDRAWVTIAAESRAKTPGEAQKLNADAMTAVLGKIKGAGLGADAIRTSSYELRPEFDYANNRQTLRGYVAQNAVEVRVDDLPKLGNILELAVGAGATTIAGIRFDLKDRSKAEQEALQQAVADARAQADVAAQAAGLKVDRVVRVEVHRQNAMPPPRPMAAMRSEMAISAEPPVAPGELEVKSMVTLTVAVR